MIANYIIRITEATQKSIPFPSLPPSAPKGFLSALAFSVGHGGHFPEPQTMSENSRKGLGGSHGPSQQVSHFPVYLTPWLLGSMHASVVHTSGRATGGGR